MKKILFFFVSLVFTFEGFSQISKNANILLKKFSNGQIISSINSEKNKFYITNKPYDLYMVGVYVDRNITPPTNKLAEPVLPNKYVANTGIVEVKYNSTNGKIHKGDPVTSSSIPGEAMKATESGMILGIALEDAKAEKGFIKIRVLIQYLR